MYIALIGLGIAIGLGGLTRVLGKNWQPKYAMSLGYAVLSLMLFSLIALPKSVMLLWLSVVPATAFFAWGYVSMMTTFSKAVDAKTQGWVMGLSTTLMALNAGIGSFLAGYLSGFNVLLPLAVGVTLGAIGCVWMLFYRQPGVLVTAK